ARVFVASSYLNKRNGLMSAVTTAVCPSIVSPNFTRSGFFAFACSNASRSRLFFATVIVARPQSFLRIAWNCGAGIPWMFTIPTTCALAHREARSSTSRFLTGATWAIEIAVEVLHRGTHRRFHVRRLDDQVRDVSRLQGGLAGSEHADANRFATSLRQDHFLVHPILRDGQVDVSQVHGELNGLLELPRLCGLQELPDGLDRMLVRHG